jgi:hypothetical protein
MADPEKYIAASWRLIRYWRGRRDMSPAIRRTWIRGYLEGIRRELKRPRKGVVRNSA